MKLVIRNEHYAVILFFAISGFLITSNTQQRYGRLGKIDAASFYAFRFARIMPCLFVLLAEICVFHALGVPRFNLGTQGVSSALAITSVLFSFHNVLMEGAGWFSYCLNILWSISVEEAFYFTSPLLCLIARQTRFIALAWVVIIVAGPIHRAIWTAPTVQGYGYLSCFDAIGFGCCTAILHRYAIAGTNQVLPIRLVGGALVVLASVTRPHMGLVLGDTFVALGMAMILFTAGQGLEREPRQVSAPIRWFGQHSYELYLFHIIMLALMRAETDKIGLSSAWRPALFLLFLCGSALLAGIVAQFYSDALNRRIRRAFIMMRGMPAIAGD